MTFSIVWRTGGRSRRGRSATRLTALLASLLVGLVLLPTAPAAGDHIWNQPHEDWNELTINIIDHNGQLACDGCAETVNIFEDTSQRGNNGLVGFAVNNGVASGRVPDGIYSIFATNVYDRPSLDHSRMSTLVELEVVVEDDTTITLDARDAVLMTQPEVPESDVQVRAHVFSLCHEESLIGNQACSVALDGSGNEYSYKSKVDCYITPFPASELKDTYLLERWILAEPQPLEPVPNLEKQRNYSPTPEYLYNIQLNYEDGVSAADLSDPSERTFTAGQFVEVPVHYHADKPGTLIETQEVAKAPYGGTQAMPHIFFEPGKVTTYYLASDRLLWERDDSLYYPTERVVRGGPLFMYAFDAFPLDEAGSRRETEHHFQAPHRHGAVEANPRFWEVFRSAGFPLWSVENNAVIPATMIRGGADGNEFLAPAFHAWNSGLHSLGPYDNELFDTSWRMWNTDTGTELNLSREDLRGGGSLPMFFGGLEPGRATYRLEQTDVYPDWMEDYFRTKPTATTVWTFESERSDAEIKTPEYTCAGLRGTVCQVQPMIQLRYEMNLDTYNQAPAGQTHTIGIEAKHHAEAVDAAPVKTITVQVTFDDGQTWAPVKARPQRGPDAEEGMFQVRIDHPALADTSGFVGLRIQATDANGGTIDQTIHCAYMLEGVDSEKVCGGPAQAPVEGSVTTAAAGAPVRVAGQTSQFVEFEVPGGLDNATAEVVATPAQSANIDLYLQRQNADGTWSDDLASGTSVGLDRELMTTARLTPGTYRIEVHNLAGPPGDEVAVTATFFNTAGEPGT